MPLKKPVRCTAFDGLDDWLRESFFRHHGNADVIRQELASEQGMIIGLRSVELWVREWRHEFKVQKRATVRFESCSVSGSDKMAREAPAKEPPGVRKAENWYHDQGYRLV